MTIKSKDCWTTNSISFHLRVPILEKINISVSYEKKKLSKSLIKYLNEKNMLYTEEKIGNE